jgi:uncharacterized membrane protein YkoI
LVLSVGARADDDDHDERDDHDLARELYEHGEIHSLSEILRIAGERAPGEVVALDLVRDGTRWVYRVQIVDRNGRRKVVDVDAGAAIFLREEGHD